MVPWGWSVRPCSPTRALIPNPQDGHPQQGTITNTSSSPFPQTVILGSRAASAAALVLCSPVSQLCIDTLVGAALALLSTVGFAFEGTAFEGTVLLRPSGGSHHQGQISLAKGGIHPLPQPPLVSFQLLEDQMLRVGAQI